MLSHSRGFHVATAVCLLALAARETTERAENIGKDMKKDRLQWKACYHGKEDKNIRKEPVRSLTWTWYFFSLLFSLLSPAAYGLVWMWKTDNLKCDHWGRKATIQCLSYLREAVTQLQNVDACICTRNRTTYANRMTLASHTHTHIDLTVHRHTNK